MLFICAVSRCYSFSPKALVCAHYQPPTLEQVVDKWRTYHSFGTKVSYEGIWQPEANRRNGVQ